MTQYHFDFPLKRDEEAKETQKWVEQHNQQVIMAARTSSLPPGSLLSAIDRREAKTNAVYLLRGVVNQHLRKSTASGLLSFKKGFLQALRGEIAVKKTAQDPAFMLRHIFLKTRPAP